MTEPVRYMSGADFLRNGIPTDVVEKLYEELNREREKDLIDQEGLRVRRMWNDLGNQVVGAEVH